jgi:RIO kinase 1
MRARRVHSNVAPLHETQFPRSPPPGGGDGRNISPFTSPMIDEDDLEPRHARPRERRHASAGRARNPDAYPSVSEAPEASSEGAFAATVQVTKSERAWIRQHLGPFHDRQLIEDVVRRVKSGKEATVYACSGHPSTGRAVIAAKLYRARSLRGERNAGQYQQGRSVLDAGGRALGPRSWRLQKAITQKSRKGREAAQSSWLMHEFSVLQALFALGADVPAPIEHAEQALLMEFIGDGHDPAPTLNEVSLPRAEAKALLERVLFDIELLLGLGWVHGDLSAHNILYQRGRIALIDFPQVVACHEHPNARAFFNRDIERITHYFWRAGVNVDPERIARQLWAKHVVNPETSA